MLVIGTATFLSAMLASLYTQLMIWGAMKVPVLLSPPFLIMLAAMTFELSRDTLRASRLAHDLRASESRLHVAAAAGGLGLWSWEGAHGHFWATSRAKAMLGIGAEERVDLARVRSLVDAHDLARIQDVLELALASGEEAEVQFRVTPPGGVTRWLVVRGRAESDRRGRPTIQGVLRDVTEQHRAREENEELRRDLAHAGRVSALGTLSSSLAHELSQPLAAILLNAEAAELLLQKPNPDLEEIRRILADIHRDDRRAGEVIDRLRRLLRRGQMDLAPLQVEGLVDDVATLLKTDAITRKVSIEYTCEPRLPMVTGDRVHLSQVLINMIINGMDAVDGQPTERRRVSLRARPADGGWVEFAVTDSGSGIDPLHMTKIFEPFFTTKSTGMGMGLSVSRTIVEAHGGRLWVENGAEGGATFRVLLPGAAFS